MTDDRCNTPLLSQGKDLWRYMRVLMGVPNCQLTTNFSANCQLTTIFLANCQLTTNFSYLLTFLISQR